MALKLNLNDLKNQSELVTSLDEEFAGTSLENTGFEIEVKKLNRSEKAGVIANLQESVNGRSINMADYNKALFFASVGKIDGFDIINPQTQQPMNNEELQAQGTSKLEILYEYGSDLLVNTIISVIESFTKVEQEKKKEEETPLTTMQNG